MKSVVMLWESCLSEAGLQHHVHTLRDLAYARARIENEGLAFLTITLPSFEKDLLSGLRSGRVDSDLFGGFHRRGGLPAFLSGFLRRIFDTDGMLRPNADPAVVRSLREVLLLVSKIELPTSSKRKAAAIRGYVETDASLEEIPECAMERFRVGSRSLLSEYLSAVESRLWSGDWVPRHSSGALASGESFNSRYSMRTWTERLSEVFPWWDDLAVNPHEVIDHRDDFSVLARSEEPPSKVALVPKTMKGPRIIAEEPAWTQFVQQGILHVMSEVLEQGRFRHLADIFSWSSQDPNRALARLGSIDGSFATVDLSEASDRVSLQLVEGLLASAPFLRRCVLASRSERAKLPSGEIISLRKFASMGSSLCFPVESMVFFVIEALAHAEACGIDPSELRVGGLPPMRVYGDDLIVPTDSAHSLVGLLETYGLKVNAHKSFTTGLFRESCGADWFKGADVSVFKIRHPMPSTRRQYAQLDSAIQFHNRAYGAGWFLVASMAESLIREVVPHVPRVPVGLAASALWSWEGPYVVRDHPHLQRTEYRTLLFRVQKPLDPLDGYGALRKYFQPKGDEPREKCHLQRDGRSRYAGVNIGYVHDYTL